MQNLNNTTLSHNLICSFHIVKIIVQPNTIMYPYEIRLYEKEMDDILYCRIFSFCCQAALCVLKAVSTVINSLFLQRR